MSTRLDRTLAAIRTLSEALPSSGASPEDRDAFIKRAKEAAGRKIKGDYEKSRAAARRRALAPVAAKHKVMMKGLDGKRSIEQIVKGIKKARHQQSVRPRDTSPNTKPAAVLPRKFESPTAQGRSRAVHGGGGTGASAGKKPRRNLGAPGRVYDPDLYEANMGNYVPRTLIAFGSLSEDILLEKRGKAARAKAAKLATAFPEQGGSKNAPKAPPNAPSPGGEKQDWRQMRKEGKLKQHKEKKGDDGKSKYENSTTFKSCSGTGGAMAASKTLRHSLPKNIFVNDDPDHPTWPVRSDCRPSMAGLGRAMQMAGPKGKSGKRGPTKNADIKSQVMGRVNKGEIRGGRRLKLWGTGVGGQRMETHRGPPGTPERDPDYGESTGKRDEHLHTARSEHSKAGNREVKRPSKGDEEYTTKKKTSKGAKKREEASRKASIKKSKQRLGLPVPGHAGLKPEPEGRGAAEAAKFLARSRSDKKQKKTHKKSKSQKRQERAQG